MGRQPSHPEGSVGVAVIILNLGSGARTSPLCINVDWSPYLRIKQSRLASRIAPVVLSETRRERFLALDPGVITHDLRKPLPKADNSVDAVYHSHVLEHFDRHLVPSFLAEVRRVLKPGGVHRVVVPDLEVLCRRYLAHVDVCASQAAAAVDHDAYIAGLIEQMVRREASGSSSQSSRRRRLENWILGDARRRGETHQWMYDWLNLRAALESARFQKVVRVDHRTSAIPTWDAIGLDTAEDGGEYIPDSLYVEARK